MNETTAIAKLDEQINAIEVKMNDPLLCKGTAAVSTRISGYYRPIGCWNDGKSQEYKERATYAVR